MKERQHAFYWFIIAQTSNNQRCPIKFNYTMNCVTFIFIKLIRHMFGTL